MRRERHQTSRDGRPAGRPQPIVEDGGTGGFVARGAIYLLIGIIALQIALGHGGQADRGGALAQSAAKSYGTVTLLLLVVGSTVWHCGGSARQLSAQLGPTVTRPASG